MLIVNCSIISYLIVCELGRLGMSLNPIMRPLGLFFFFSGLIQGIFWFIFAILSILLSGQTIEIYSAYSHSGYMLYTWYDIYFVTGNITIEDGTTITLMVNKDVFLGFMIAYLILSVIWIGVSATSFYYLRFEKWRPIRSALILHVVVVTLISIIDIVLMSFLAADYNKCENKYDEKFQDALEIYETMNNNYYLMVIGIMLTMAARGFILWFINVLSVIYAICFIVECYDYDNQRSNNILYNLPIDAYREYPGDPNFAEAMNAENFHNLWYRSSYSNDAYLQETSLPQNGGMMQGSTPELARNRNLERSLSNRQSNLSQRQMPLNINNINSHNNTEQLRTDPATSQYAKPNKPVKAAVPPAPPPKPSKKGPPVPFPDYTPPQSPKILRPVIKQNSSYY